MYIEIDGERYPCEIEVSATQIGNPLIRVISDAPVAENGFLLINGEKVVDKSDFTYLYREDGPVKEYCQNAEEIIPAEGNQSECPVNPIQRQFAALNKRVSDITPYTMSKQAYIGDTACVFEPDKTGDISAYVVDNDGNYIQCTITRETGKITILFDELEQIATVNVAIQ